MVKLKLLVCFSVFCVLYVCFKGNAIWPYCPVDHLFYVLFYLYCLCCTAACVLK